MADIPEVVSSDPVELLGVGRRHLAVRDYSSAVSSLGKACELLAQKYGQQADECGEAYLWYGKSLLGLAREESGVLGDGIPQGGEDNQEDDDEEEGGDDENEVEMNGDDELKKDDEVSQEDNKEKMETSESGDAAGDKNSESKDETCSSAAADEAASSTEASNFTSNGEPGGSGMSSKNGEEDVEEDEDEVENLQVAWEVLELARDIFIKRGDSGKKELADVFLHLGEVSLESETYDKAIIDMGKSLELFKELYSADDRRIAETHYQIGLAHSLSNGFDDAVNHFKTAAEILNARIKTLESPTVANDDVNVKKYLASDPFYSVEGEIKELKELLPEIHEKIQDMMDYKAEAIKSVRESLGLSSNGESSKTNGTSKEPEQEKKASDISHLIKRKRKPSDEVPTEEASAAKKVAQ